MQKALRYNLLARNNAAKKARKSLFFERKGEEKEYERWASIKGKALRSQVRTERRNRREDWIAGPLAADRNTGLHKGTLGVVHPSQAQEHEIPGHVLGAPKPPDANLGMRKEWEGEGNLYNIIVGDRVCVVRGAEGVVGQIGTVTEVTPARGTLQVVNVNMGDVAYPPNLPKAQSQAKVTSLSLPLKYTDVRLVAALEDPDTGHKRDVIVRHLKGGAPWNEREYGSNHPRHTRYIAGEDIPIEWPEAEIAEQERHIVDTARYDVEVESYIPSIIHPPLPDGVVHELTNKYGRERSRHENEWLQRKIIEDTRSAWYEQRQMLTPKQQYEQLKRPLPEDELSQRTKAEMETERLIREEQSRAFQQSAH